MNNQPATLLEMLVLAQKSGQCIRTMDLSGVESVQTYAEVFDQALRTLAVLDARGLRSGDELIIQLEDPKEFINVFWACLLGGIVAVPLSLANNRSTIRKLANVWTRLRAPYLYTSHNETEKIWKVADELGLGELLAAIKTATILTSDVSKEKNAPLGRVQDRSPEDLAFVQFSSGSTGLPKGVMLSHRNVLTNLDSICHAYQLNNQTSTLSWMPLTHDMGMVGFHLTPLYLMIEQTIIATSRFVHDPSIWLRKLSEYKISVTSSPNFGYDHLLKRGRVDQLEGLDLSHVVLILNGAEPISPILCGEFSRRLARFGLAPNTIIPSYGMAEAGVFVSCPEPGRPIGVVEASRRRLGIGCRILPPESPADTLSLVELGGPGPRIELRVVDDQSRRLDDGWVGNIEIRGDNVTKGYYRDADASSAAFTDDGWLKTGDHGFWHDGQLVFAGRAKDMICANGQNLYAQDVEQAISEQLKLDLRKVAVCGAPCELNAKEELIAFIVHKGTLEELAVQQSSLRSSLSALYGYQLDRLLPVPLIPMTTSGKKQRQSLQQAYMRGEFAQAAHRIEEIVSASSDSSAQDNQWRNEIEKRVAEVCQHELPDTLIGRASDLFQLGLNSLGATRLLFNLQETFDVVLPPDMLLVCMNIATIAQRIATYKNCETSMGLSSAANFAEIESRFSMQFNIQIRLVLYKTELESIVVLYCQPDDKARALDLLHSEVEPSIYPGHVRPLADKPDGIQSEISCTQEELMGALRLAQYDEHAFNRMLSSVEQGYRKTDSEFSNDTMEIEYPVGPHQRRHLRRKLIQPHVFDISTHAPSDNRILDVLSAFISTHDLLRATIHETDGVYRFRVRSSREHVSIPMVDISGYRPSVKSMISDRLRTWVEARFQVEPYLDHPLYRLLIIKHSETSYSFLFLISHIISDRESGRILKTYLEQTLHAHLQPECPPSYKQFVETIAEPSCSAGERFCRTQLCTDVQNAINELNSLHHIDTPAAPFSAPVSIIFRHEFLTGSLTAAHHRPANFALYVYLLLVHTLFPVPRMPVKVALNRRVFGSINYYNTVGEFHDNIILTLEAADLSPESCHRYVNDALHFMDVEGFYLSAMKDVEQLRAVAGSTPLSFNHLGDLSHAEDTFFLSRLRPFPLTFFPSLSYSIENKWIRIVLNNGINPGQMSQVHNALVSIGLDFSTTLLTMPNESSESMARGSKEHSLIGIH